jgi:hypothetical protein
MARGTPARTGTEYDIGVTLVAADRTGLACVLPWSYERYRCAFQAENAAFQPPPTEAERLQPFVTLDREVYLLGGLFADPAVTAHLARASAGERFVTNCRVRFVRRALGVKLRFSGSDPWHDPKEPVWLAIPVKCSVP